jgi:hypothetical protein
MMGMRQGNLMNMGSEGGNNMGNNSQVREEGVNKSSWNNANNMMGSQVCV